MLCSIDMITPMATMAKSVVPKNIGNSIGSKPFGRRSLIDGVCTNTYDKITPMPYRNKCIDKIKLLNK